MTSERRRRYVILAEGWFSNRHAKTAHGVIRYGRDETVAVIDSTLAGSRVLEVLPELGRDAPIVSSLEEAMEYSPTSILVGLAPPGGALPESWKAVLREAAGAGLEIVSGLHQRLAPKFPGAKVWDVREPPEDTPLFSGAAFDIKPKVVLAVGTDSAVGKMTATLEIGRAAMEEGISSEFVATGQTGVIIAGWGTCIDAVVSDFAAGAVEQLALKAAERDPELILVEGQGALGHPAYSGVTTALLHGCSPDCLVLCTSAAREEVFPRVPAPDIKEIISLYERVAGLVKPAPVVAISVNTRSLSEAAAREAIDNITAAADLPVVDPIRTGAAQILEAIRQAPKINVTGGDKQQGYIST